MPRRTLRARMRALAPDFPDLSDETLIAEISAALGA